MEASEINDEYNIILQTYQGHYEIRCPFCGNIFLVAVKKDMEDATCLECGNRVGDFESKNDLFQLGSMPL